MIKIGKIYYALTYIVSGSIFFLYSCTNFPTPVAPKITATHPIENVQLSSSTPGPTLSPTRSSTTVEPSMPSTTNTLTPEETLTISPPQKFPMTLENIPEPVVYPQAGTPSYLINYLHPEAGCNWLGVVGQIFDLNGKPVIGKIIEINGKFDGTEILGLGLTGSANYLGPGGYEIKLADAPKSSTSPLRIQVFNSEGTPLSDPLSFSTYNDCNKNLIIINFLLFAQPLKYRQFFPIIGK